MANTTSQASQIRDLLVERLEAYDPTLATGEGGNLYEQVIRPVFDALSIDPFDTDIEEFLLTRLRQEFPSVSAQPGDAIVDIVVRPLQLMLEAFKRELQIIRTGQSVRNAAQMRIQDAEDLAANFFVSRRAGSRASGTVRVFFANPTFVSILASTRFTASGLNFFPLVPEFFRPEIVAAQRSGQFYYIDIGVIAELPGESYNVQPGAITQVSGIDAAVRVTNQFAFSNGSDDEDAEQLLSRTRSALTERSLNTRRGIRARIFSEFPSIRNLEVVGFGDPEMQRDKVTGSGGGDVICSGMSLVIGRYLILLSMFENRGRDGLRRIRNGGQIDLNFWHYLYGTQEVAANQRFLVEEVLYESSADLAGIPTVYLIRLNHAPNVATPPGSLIPGLLPGVFAAAYDRAELRISGIPGGITNPDEEDEIVIRDDQVHIGGKYDVYVRPNRSSTTVSSLTSTNSEVAVFEGTDLFTIAATDLEGDLADNGAFANKVNAKFSFQLVSITGTFQQGEAFFKKNGSSVEYDTGGLAYDIYDNGGNRFIDVIGMTSDAVWEVGYEIEGSDSGATAVIAQISTTNWEDVGVRRGMILQVINSPDAGSYKIMEVRGSELILDSDMTVTGGDYRFRIVDEVVVDAFDPKAPLYPFAGQTANDLRTVIGSATVRTSVDLVSFGVQQGSVLDILDGSNVGQYRIIGFDPVLGGKAPILESAMTATDGNVSFRVYAGGSGLSRPLVRIAHNGMVIRAAGGQSLGYSVPPALPVGARAVESLSGARELFRGLNGFVLADAGPAWEPTSHVRLTAYDIDLDDPTSGATSPASGTRSPDGTIRADDLNSITRYSGGPGVCYSSECLPTDDDFIAVLTVAQDSPLGSPLQTYLSINLPAEAKTFLQTIRSWLVDLVENFELGDDFAAFFNLFAPFTLDPIPSTAAIFAQYEVLIPRALFDGCNNIFIATPEFDWDAAFSENSTFQDAMDSYNNGELRNTPAALARAKAGDILTIDSGANAGSYVIEKVYTYTVYHGGCIVTSGSEEYLDDRVAYTYAIVKIKNEFPVNPYKGLSEFTPSSTPALSLPAPSFNVSAQIAAGPDAGDPLNPWLIVQESFTWFFQLLSSAGYDVPSQFVVNPASVLKKIVQGFFSPYVVGRPTAEQIVRMYFTEPTSVTAYGPSSCARYVWNEIESDEEQVLYVQPKAPTIFSVVAGSEALLFTATATELPRQLVPGSSRGTRVGPKEMPRDVELSAHATGSTAFEVTPSDALLPSFLNAGVQAGTDFVNLHEQRVLLEVVGALGTEKADRVVTVTMQAGSSILRLPRLTYGTREFTFLSPSSDSILDVVRPGDYVFIEEGDATAGYRISEVGDEYVVVDGVMPVTTEIIYKAGNEGALTSGTSTLIDTNNPFSSADVGRYLTIFLSDYAGVDGSYQITAVSGGGSTVTLDTDADFSDSESGVHWAVVGAPVDDLDESSIEGTTELVGMRPVRFYSGTPSSWPIVEVSPSVDRLTSKVVCAYRGAQFEAPYARQRELETLGPVRGVKQPYEIVRPHVVHLSSSEMRAQGTENGLFFMDVRIQSLGGRAVFNLPKDTILTPVFGTFDSDGYRFEVDDPLYTYSSAERAKLYFSASFLPNELDDLPENRVILNGANFDVSHETSPEVAQVQSLLVSDLNRTLCADPLARHFLPSFVYLDIEVVGGDRAKMAGDIAKYINGLEPNDVLDVSKLEKFLHSNNVTSYRHPVNLQIVTHDADRRRVLSRSSDRIGTATLDFNGTHRTTFYIPGPAATTEPASLGQERILVRPFTNGNT
jgi:hypothetical protein